MKASRICPFLLFLLLACIPSTHASQTLEITVKTDKSTYLQGENVTIGGYVILDALTQPSNGEISGDQRILTIVLFVGVLVALGVIASAFVFLVLRRFKRDREPPAVPREDVNERYKKCVKCGRRILWFRTFCPYCYGYQGKIKTGER